MKKLKEIANDIYSTALNNVINENKKLIDKLIKNNGGLKKKISNYKKKEVLKYAFRKNN